MVWLWLLPTGTLPNASLAGFSASWPPDVPVPARESVAAAFDASLLTVTFPEKLPAALGENITLKLALWPEEIVTGRVGAVTEKYLLETAALLIVTANGPEFDALTERVLLAPTATSPKFKFAAARDNVETWF